MSLIDLWKGFHSDAIQLEYSPSARVLFDTLIFKLNERYWQDNLVLSERDLIQLTGLKKTTLHDAKHFLASRHIIKCTQFKNKTSYSLGEEMKALLNRPVTDQQPTTNRPAGDQFSAVPIKRAREDNKDFKTLDFKTNKTDLSAITAIACAREINNTEENELDKVIDYWEQSRFGKLDFELISKLESYVKRYGFSEVKAAMDAAKASNGSSYGVSFAYFASVLENRNKPKNLSKKGGEKVGETSGDFNYKPVTFDDSKPLW